MTSRSVEVQTPLQRILDFEAEYVQIGNESKDSYAKLMADWSSGQALQELDVDEEGGEEEAIRVYPVGVNYCQRVVSAVSGVTWGEWDQQRPARVFLPQFDVPNTREKASGAETDKRSEGSPISQADLPLEWGLRGLRQQSDTVRDMLLRVLFGEIKGNSVFSEWLEGAVSRGTASLYLPYQYRTGRFSASVLPLQYVHYMWDDNGVISEAAITKSKTIYEAQQMGWLPTPDWIRSRSYLGLSTPDRVVYWEHWTPWSYSTWIEDQMLEAMPNPTMGMRGLGGLEQGIIPLFPLRLNRPADEWYGHSDIEASIDICREINRVTADIGENVNMSNVPLIWFLNCSPDGSSKTDGDYLQRVGKHTVLMLKGDPQGAKVGSIERPVLPPDTAKYLEALVQFLEDTGLLPGPVLGRVRGTQTSGVALQTEMRPIIDVARRHRVQVEQVLQDVVGYMLSVAAATNLDGRRNMIAGRVWGVTRADVETLVPRFYVGFAPLLPKDMIAERDGIISEVINFLEYPENALRRLGREDPAGDWEKIKEFQEWKSQLATQVQGQIPGQAQPGKPGQLQPDPVKRNNALAQKTANPQPSTKGTGG